ncbi:MAG: Hpt domain-containing protein, partial [Candidatus Limnocylindria bacterium]
MALLSDELPPEMADRALREAHKLAGSLGTFGLPRGSEIARGIESWFTADGEAGFRDPVPARREGSSPLAGPR